MSARVLAIGGAHVDRRGRIHGPAVAGASNPGQLREEAGGGVFNAARTLARLGHAVRLIAPRGGDPAGERVAEAAAAAGIDDTPLVFLDRATPSYTAIIDASGDLVIGLADMALYDLYGPRQIARRGVREAIAAADLVLTDANLAEATLVALATACRRADRPLMAIAISPAKVVRLKPILPMLAALFMNGREAAALVGAAESTMTDASALAGLGLARAIVSRGAAPVDLVENGMLIRLVPPPAADIADVTGAGDALAAGCIDGLLAGLPAAEAVRRGLAAAALTLTVADAAAAIDRARLSAALASVPAASPAVPLAPGRPAT